MGEYLGPAGERVLLRLQDALGGSKILDPVGVSGSITPVYDLAPQLCEFNVDDSGVVDPGAAGAYTFLTVPVNELWQLFYTYVNEETATCTFDALIILHGSTVFVLEQTAAATLLKEWPPGTFLPAGANLRVVVASYSTGTLRARTYVAKFRQLTPASMVP